MKEIVRDRQPAFSGHLGHDAIPCGRELPGAHSACESATADAETILHFLPPQGGANLVDAFHAAEDTQRFSAPSSGDLLRRQNDLFALAAGHMTDDQIARFEDVSLDAVAMRLRAVMANAGHGITDFGRALGGVHRVTVQSWVKAKSAPKREHLAAICRDYDVTTDFLILGDWRRLSADRWAALRSAIVSEKQDAHREG